MKRRDFLAGMPIAAGLLHAGHAPATAIPSTANSIGNGPTGTNLPGTELDHGVSRATGLVADFTFDRFIEGRANEYACAVAFAICSNPHSIRCPLVIHGAVGLGKTHLMQAIGHQILDQNSHARIRYVHAVGFHEQLHLAHKDMAMDDFRKMYNSLDVLLLDDVQYLDRHPGTQGELLRTLNTIAERRGLIVMTADSLPLRWTYRNVTGALKSSLVSRIHGGKLVEICRPDFALRKSFLEVLAQREDLSVSKDVVQYVAKRLRSQNMRTTEGMLNRIAAYSRFHGRNISHADARRLLAGIG